MKSAGAIAPHTLQRRLLLSYVGAFAVVIAVFAIAVRLSFGTLLEAATTSRLVTLARAGTASVAFTGPNSPFVVNDQSFGGFSLHAQTEGLEWFDVAGRRVAARGQTPPAGRKPTEGLVHLASAQSVLDTYTLKLLDLRGTTRGFVRASEVYNPAEDPERLLERVLAVGAALALLAGALGGALLARTAVGRAEASYERLRQFTADASHELRGPLAALATTSSVALREAPELPEVTRSRLDAIASLAAHMRRLVDDLLILARADRSLEHELFAVDLHELLQTVEARYGGEAERRGVTLDVAPKSGIEIFGNPDQLERIVANLVDNAVRYSQPGGSVAVSCNVDQGRVFVTVTDSGAGIEPQFLERVFDRFWRGDPARAPERGTGLGLAIARALARRHGGDVIVASELGRGSTFALTLPLRPPSLG